VNKNRNLKIENEAHRLKKQHKQNARRTTKKKNDVKNADAEANNTAKLTFTMNEIGIISSPFPQRAGTPRQGLLANHVRSILTLHSDIVAKETLDDLEQYSHLWIIFQFHLNPVGKAKDKKSEGKKLTFHSSKVCPPRAHGKKVGVFATRSPHRPNNIGLSVAKIESITTETYLDKSGVGTKERKRTVIKLLGLDLVDQTPVYDIKPYLKTDAINDPDIINPDWVISQDDKLARVQWQQEAKDNLYQLQKKGLLMPFYSPKNSKDDDDDEAYIAISQIIAQDPRAHHEERGKQSHHHSFYEITFCRTRVSFSVQLDETSKQERENRYYALIMNVLEDKGDLKAVKGSYPYQVAQSSINDLR
jgi:tRNA-Thr(GGU) m(6)t(6)A37 methyltransferase TsaA